MYIFMLCLVLTVSYFFTIGIALMLRLYLYSIFKGPHISPLPTKSRLAAFYAERHIRNKKAIRSDGRASIAPFKGVSRTPKAVRPETQRFRPNVAISGDDPEETATGGPDERQRDDSCRRSRDPRELPSGRNLTR